MILLLKAYNRGYTYTRNGKTVTVKPFSDKRPTASGDTATQDLFDRLPDKARGHGERKVPPRLLVRDKGTVDDKAAIRDLFDAASPMNYKEGVGATPTPSSAVSEGSKKERIMYDTLDLSSPEAYQDPDVADAARYVGNAMWETHGKSAMGRGDFKRAVKEGKFPHLVKQVLDERAKEKSEKEKAVTAGADIAAEIAIPGHDITVEGETIVISGPFDADLHERIKRAGGSWDGASGSNRRVWLFPAEKGKSLKRIAGNMASALEKKAQADAAKRDEKERLLAVARAKAPDIDPGKYGPFTVRRDGDGYRVAFPYDAYRVSQVRDQVGGKYRPDDKTWWIDKANAKDLLRVLDRAKEIAVQQAAEKPTVKPAAEAKPARQPRRVYPLSSMPPLNTPVRVFGKPVVFTGTGQTFRISEDDPSVHGSHLLGHEGDRAAYAYYRDATPDESAQLEAQEAEASTAAQKEKAKKEALRQAREDISSRGERPEGATPEGEVLHDTTDIYGGGDRFVVGEDYIWYIRNNGMDGDDWSRNNVRTGGAGAIGWRVPYSEDLAQRLREA